MTSPTSKRNTVQFLLTTCTVLTVSTIALALSKLPPAPLGERVSQADSIFVGTVANKVVEGDWVRADLIVEEPLKKAKKGEAVPVTWRLIMVGGSFQPEKVEGSPEVANVKRVGGKPIFDAPEGARGIAILSDKHEGRYWLRDDKFEDISKLAEVKKLIEAEGDKADTDVEE